MHPWICRIPSLKCSHNLHKFPIFSYISLVSFSTSTPKISALDYLVDNHQFSPECAAKVSSSSTKYLNKPQNADSVVGFFREIGFSKNQIESATHKVPNVLSVHLERTIKPKFKVLQDLGFHSTDLADIISSCPWLLNSSAGTLRLSISGLKNVLGPNADICRLLKYYSAGRFLMQDLNRKVVPNIEYLKSCGICSLQIASYVCRYPWLFQTTLENFRSLVQRADEMDVNRKSKMFIEAVRVMRSMSRGNWELKLDVFRELGFSEHNILVAFRRMPTVFGESEKKLKEVTQLLLSFEDISYIASHPVMLSYSVEKRLKPRFRVLNALLSKNLLKKKPALDQFLAISDARFIDKYVSPNTEYLKSCGICSLQIASYVFQTKPAKLVGLVERADEMGVDRNSKMFIEAVRVMGSMSRESWELKLDVFREVGFSEEDILVAFRRMPPVFGTSEKKIKEVTQLLLNFEDVSYIASHPAMLGYSVEKRLKPRLRVLNALLSKSLLKKNLSLSQFLMISDAVFKEKYVDAFSNEVGGLDGVSQG